MSDTFKCACCKKTFNKGRTDEAAKAEALANGYDPDNDCDLTCDVCYHKYFARYLNVNGAASINAETKEILANEPLRASDAEWLDVTTGLPSFVDVLQKQIVDSLLAESTMSFDLSAVEALKCAVETACSNGAIRVVDCKSNHEDRAVTMIIEMPKWLADEFGLKEETAP